MQYNIGLYLKKIREEKSLSQKLIAKRLKYKNINFISMIENGVSKIPINRIMDFVDAYELPAFFGFVLIREIYGDTWKVIIDAEKINPQFENLSFKKLDKKISGLYKAELKKFSIKNI